MSVVDGGVLNGGERAQSTDDGECEGTEDTYGHLSTARTGTWLEEW